MKISELEVYKGGGGEDSCSRSQKQLQRQCLLSARACRRMGEIIQVARRRSRSQRKCTDCLGFGAVLGTVAMGMRWHHRLSRERKAGSKGKGWTRAPTLRSVLWKRECTGQLLPPPKNQASLGCEPLSV